MSAKFHFAEGTLGREVPPGNSGFLDHLLRVTYHPANLGRRGCELDVGGDLA